VQVGVIVAGLAAAAFAVAFLPGFLVRINGGGEEFRAGLVANALAQFNSSPLIGTGPGTWVAQRVAFTPANTLDYYIPHAHNVFVQTLSELGILGAAGGLLGLVILGRLLVEAIRSGDRRRQAMAWASAFGIVYFAGHNLFDFELNFTPALIALAVPVAYLDATSSSRNAMFERLPPVARRGAPLAGVLAIVVAVGFLTWSESQATLQAQAVAAINADRPADGLEAARAAALADPGFAAYHLTHAIAAYDTNLLPEAAEAFRTAASLDDLPNAWLGLAAAETRLGNTDDAKVALDRALRLGRQQPAILLAAAALERSLHDDGAASLLADLLAARPCLAEDAGFRALAGTDLVGVTAEAARQLDGTPAEVELDLCLRRDEDATAAAGSLTGDVGAVMRLVVQGWHGSPYAREALDQIAHTHPLDQTALGWSARLARRAGDTEAAADDERWGNLASVYAGFLARPTGTAPRGGSAVGTVGSTAQFYGHYTYRRPTPWDLIPIDLPHLIDENVGG
jgi:tetratricopeptide (TPR) repeat protein